jgi:nucleoside-diphosphate-sugar epimerase
MGQEMINIIGGSGFIGTRISTLLTQSKIKFKIVDKVLSVSFPKQAQLADVRSLHELDLAISDEAVLINLAAEHRDDVTPISLYDDVNVQGALNICHVASKKNINKIIFTSSVAVYGFAPLGTDETGEIRPFNDYGRTKYEAEKIFRKWQEEDLLVRTLVIIRPTVVFGEQNRGNVYNLLRQIASGKFVMIGDGLNRKSMAYVGNVVAFIQFSLTFKPGVHIYNYIDKPDFTMNELVSWVNKLLGKSTEIKFRLPYQVGLLIGRGFDVAAKIMGKKLPISTIRVKKFCSNSVYESAIHTTGFTPPFSMLEAVERTIKYEFLEEHNQKQVFYSE